MTPRERVLTALEGEEPDRVPWIEGIVENGIATAVCGVPINVDWSVAPDGFPKMPGEELAEEQKKVNRVLGKANIQFSAFAPIFAHKLKKADDGSPVIVGEGKISNREEFDEFFDLPDPEDSSFVENARRFIACKDEYCACACACVRLGIGATLMSMGLEGFSFAMVDDPQLIVDIHSSYAEWTTKVIPVLEEIGFDVIWAFDDVAFNSGPVFSPDFYRARILPTEKKVASVCTKPLITHSDGDMSPLLDDWLELGQAGIHPIQTDVMDIYEVAEICRDKVCIVGNIFMPDLVSEDSTYIAEQVRERMERLAPGGGYIISSSNSLTDDMNHSNIFAMRDAIARYGDVKRNEQP